MLVLSRKIGEYIQIGDGVVVTVREMRGGRVRLAVEAPQEVLVLRGELAAGQPSALEWRPPAK
jgi:carbon storage regulator